MRTTMTLDDDVAAQIRRLQRDRQMKLKDVVNQALRQGLQMMTRHPVARVPYRLETLKLGPCLVGSLDNVEEALAIAEGDDHL